MKMKPISIQAQACAASEDWGLSKNSQSRACTLLKKDAWICGEFVLYTNYKLLIIDANYSGIKFMLLHVISVVGKHL